MTYPEVPAQEAIPAAPARTEGSLWWKKTIPEQPGKPAVPGTPARTVKTRRRLGDAASVAANQTQDPNDSELPPPEESTASAPVPAAMPSPPPANPTEVIASGPTFAEKVRVVHPDGRTGLIPKAQLQAAMAQGYKLAQ